MRSTRTTRAALAAVLATAALCVAHDGGAGGAALAAPTKAVAKAAAKSALERARDEAARELRLVDRAAAREIRAATKAGTKRLRLLGKTIRAGRPLDAFAPPATSLRKTGSGALDLVTAMEILFGVTTEAEDAARFAALDAEREKARLLVSIGDDNGVSPLELLPPDDQDGTAREAVAADARLRAEVAKVESIVRAELPDRGLVVGLHVGAPPSLATALAAEMGTPVAPLPELRFTVATDTGDVTVLVSPGQGTTTADVDVEGILKALGGAAAPIALDVTPSADLRWWSLGATDLEPGAYALQIDMVDGAERCCVARNVLYVPEPPPPAAGAAPTDTRLDVTFTGAYTMQFTLNDSNAQFNRVVLDGKSGNVVYAEFAWQGMDAANTAASFQLNFGANGKSYDSGAALSLAGDGDDVTSFQLGRVENMLFVDRGTPFGAQAFVDGTLTLFDTQGGDFLLTIDITCPIVERTGDRTTQIATAKVVGTIAVPISREVD